MYQKILVAVDISDEARQVLKKAAKITKIHQAQLSILHVAPLPVTGYDGLFGQSILVNKQILKEALYLNLVEMVEEQHLPKETAIIKFGRAIDVIINQAEHQETDLIITGSHGRHGVGLILGSTANGVLHRAKCDVLALRIQE